MNIADNMSGIYKMLNLVNGKFYIGMSNNLKRRYIDHCTPRSRKKTTTLAKAIKKYGIGSFFFEIIEVYVEESELFEREKYWIELLKPEYNMNEGGKGNKGHKLTPEMKKHLSEIAKKQWENKSEEQKQAIIKNNLKGPAIGHEVSKETREKLRLNNLGKKQSTETIKKRVIKIRQLMSNNTRGNKPIICYYKGLAIAKFPSAKEAALLFKIHPSCITGVLKGRRKNAAGFTWNYFKPNTK